MQKWRTLLFLAFLATSLSSADAANARIKKVLPHYLDQRGRHMLAPSLYERDAYQAHLRQNLEECSALRFDINWKATGFRATHLKLRLELRSSHGNLTRPLILETTVKPARFFSRWSSLTLGGGAFENAGPIVAWRATLWDNEILLTEQKSFLW